VINDRWWSLIGRSVDRIDGRPAVRSGGRRSAGGPAVWSAGQGGTAADRRSDRVVGRSVDHPITVKRARTGRGSG